MCTRHGVALNAKPGDHPFFERAVLEEISGRAAAVRLKGNAAVQRQALNAMSVAVRNQDLDAFAEHDAHFHRSILEARIRISNASIAGELQVATEIIDRYPGKFVGFGSIGFGDCQRSIAEVDRCIKKLGFKGIQIFSNISNKLLDSQKFVSILKHIAELGVPIHLHPAIPLNRLGLNSSNQFLSLGFPYDTSLNVLRLIQTGLFDVMPDLKLIVAHAGGVIPYLWGRIRTYNAPSPFITELPRLRHPIEHYLSKLYVDTVCYHVEALKCCYDVMGAEHLLYGTDHPFGRYNVAAELVEQLDCTASDRDLIYNGNAERLLNSKDLTSETSSAKERSLKTR